jgi:dienelactone hydrolase
MHNRKFLLILGRTAAAVLVAVLLNAGCTRDDDKGNGTPPEPPDGNETTLPSCTYRPEAGPPAYTWTYRTAQIGRTTARFFAPASPVGLVVLFDGGGGVELWFSQIEPRLLVEALVEAGYAILALESDDPNDGDYDGTPDAAANVDLVNLQAAVALARSLESELAEAPLFYLGFSSGGYFASLAARYEPAAALALLNVRGDTVTYDPAENAELPPTIWVIGRNDPMVTPDDPDLNGNKDQLLAAGVDHELLINEPLGALDTAFTRIADGDFAVGEADSIDAVAALLAAGYLDGCRVPVAPSADLDLAAISLGPTFLPPGEPSNRFTEEAKRQLDELYGAHQVTSDFDAEIVAFFDARR